MFNKFKVIFIDLFFLVPFLVFIISLIFINLITLKQILLLLMVVLLLLIFIIGIELKGITYNPFVSKLCSGFNSSKDVEYIVNSCTLATDDFITISNKTDNYFLQESERYFDYNLFFGSVGLSFLVCLLIIPKYLWILFYFFSNIFFILQYIIDLKLIYF